MEESIFLKSLNENQKKAVQTTEGYVRVVAGPGSGKTRTLVNRYGYLINEHGVPSDAILCITFTNKAANVMKTRLKSMIGPNFNGSIYTFHGFCARILRDEIYHLHFPMSYNILDDDDVEKILKDIYKMFNLSKSELKYNDVRNEIVAFKKINFESYIEFLSDQSGTKKIDAPNYIKEYLEQQRHYSALDFADLINFALYIFGKWPNVLEKYQNKYVYVMVDEFQDVTSSEFQIASLISQKNSNLFVVGDPDQMIYSWRGAQDFIYSFDSIFPNVKTIYLDTNYRSTPEIISVSNSLISKNTKRLDKNMNTINSSFKKPYYGHFEDRTEEAYSIAYEIESLHRQKIPYKDIAIIYRANHHSRFIEEALVGVKIPYILLGGVGFYQRQEVKDLLSYLRFVESKDDLSFLRIINEPSRGFGNKKIELIQSLQQKNGKSLYDNLLDCISNKTISVPAIDDFVKLIKKATKMKEETKISELLVFLYEKSGYKAKLTQTGDDDRIDNVAELVNSIQRLEDADQDKLELGEFLQNVALLSDNDRDDNTADKVRLMTAHISKGQEFPYVFVCAFNENSFPISRAVTPGQVEEERRLAYVAFTRAEKQLYVTDSEGFDFNNSPLIPSRFIFDINKDCFEWIGKEIDAEMIQDVERAKERTAGFTIEKRLANMKVGRRVFCRKHGKGRITKVDEKNEQIEIQFDEVSELKNFALLDPEIFLINDYSYETASTPAPYSKPQETANVSSHSTSNNSYSSSSTTSKPSSQTTTNDVYLSVTDIMNSYGYSRYYVMKFIHSGSFPTYKQGNKYLVKKSDFDEYLRKRRIQNWLVAGGVLLFIIIFLIILFSIFGKYMR